MMLSEWAQVRSQGSRYQGSFSQETDFPRRRDRKEGREGGAIGNWSACGEDQGRGWGGRGCERFDIHQS